MNPTFHIQWCTKYRRRVFRGIAVPLIAGECIREAVAGQGIIIHELTVQPEHVHALVELPLGMPVPKAVQFLKGGSARRIFKWFPWMRAEIGDHLWSAGHFYRVVEDQAAFMRVRAYIKRHDEAEEAALELALQIRLQCDAS